MVLLADRHAAAGQHQIVVARGLTHRLHGCGALVRDNAQIADAAAQALQHGTQKETVGVVDGARLHGFGCHLTRHHQLVTGRKQRHPRPTTDLQPIHADARCEPQFGWPQPPAALQHHRAARHVLAGASYPLPRLRHLQNAQQWVYLPGICGRIRLRLQFAILLHHNRVGAGRNRRSGEDARSAARLQRRAAGARRDALCNPQPRLQPDQVGTAQRVAVHRAVVVRGHLQRRDDIAGQDPGVGVEGGNRLGTLERLGRREQLGQGVV